MKNMISPTVPTPNKKREIKFVYFFILLIFLYFFIFFYIFYFCMILTIITKSSKNYSQKIVYSSERCNY
jgi:polyferredoxin